MEQPVLPEVVEEDVVTITDETSGALTPEGNLTLVDDYHTNYSDGSGQQFITLVSKSGATFYLVIDRNAKGQQTVHFMNLVDEADLLSLMEDEDAEAYTAEKEAAAQAEQDRLKAEEEAKKAAEEAEKAADPAKADTGLFFFKGNPGERFAICNAGGGFAYVGAMHDSFPHALELSKKGYNAFALIYRPGWDTAVEDLARAIGFIFEHAEELEVDTDCYSLWGGSAGGRMTAYLGSYGPAAFGGDDLPRPGTAIIQYTGHSEYTENDPPTYSCVGDHDGIASYHTMQSRLNAMSAIGIDTEFHIYEGLGHGFGLGTGTVAEGWIDDAVAFWEKQMD